MTCTLKSLLPSLSWFQRRRGGGKQKGAQLLVASACLSPVSPCLFHVHLLGWPACRAHQQDPESAVIVPGLQSVTPLSSPGLKGRVLFERQWEGRTGAACYH